MIYIVSRNSSVTTSPREDRELPTFLTMDDFNFENKTAIIRVDFNSPLDPSTKMITDETRIRRHAATIKELMAMRAKVVILAHQGRKGNPDFSSLAHHALVLSNILGQKVAFDAVQATIDRRIRIALGGDDAPVLRANQNAATCATVPAGRLVPANQCPLRECLVCPGEGHTGRGGRRSNRVSLNEFPPCKFHCDASCSINSGSSSKW